MTRKVRLSIVIPAYQEAARIEQTLVELAHYLKANPMPDTEVVVVSADSPDGTAELAQAKSKLFKDFRFIAAGPRAGKGRDVRLGMLSAAGSYRLFMDADMATPIHHLAVVEKLINEDTHIAIGVRNLRNTHSGLRSVISNLGNLLVRGLLLPGIRDSQCGFKLFSAEATERIFSRQTIVGWGFDMEILAIAKSLGYEIKTFNIPDWKVRTGGTFDSQVGSAALTTLLELLAIWWRITTRQYKNPSFRIHE